MPNVPRGHATTVGSPQALTDATAPAPDDERWLTVTVSLAADTPWAAAGHEIAFAQALLARPLTGPAAARATPAARVAPAAAGRLTLGAAVLDRDTGELRRLGPFGVHSADLDFW